MALARVLLLAAALTLPLAYTAVTITAEAAGKSAAKSKKATKAAYKTCGTFKYWKDGKCEDARAKKK